jgi:RNA polymerase sigma-70 factor, ECF subfamily
VGINKLRWRAAVLASIAGPMRMSSDSSKTDELIQRAKAGEDAALAELFARYRDRLKRMVRLRLDHRLAGRLDPSDVIQDTFLDVSRRFPEYASHPSLPFFLWIRSLAGQRLVDLHRMHLGAKMRNAGQEVSLHRGALPAVSSVSLANQLLGRLTSPTAAAARTEMQIRLQDALNQMDPIDREVVVLRHFEELDNAETAEILGLQPSAASKRYIRAIRRLKVVLDDFPDLV